MIRLFPIQASCPTCGSRDVFYTCHTSCCFNHVCNDCRTTFELATRLVGRTEERPAVPEDRDTSLPMVRCGACEKTNVFQAEGWDELLCVSCHSLLALEYEKIVSDHP